MNKMIADKLGYTKKFNEAAKHAYTRRHGYILISCSSKIVNSKLRVCTNLFGDSDKYAVFHA